MSEVLSALAELTNTRTAAALCTIIRAKGSTPRSVGCKMLVYTDGSIVGTIGGGEVEGRVIQEALASIQSGESNILSYDLINPEEGDPGICGGTLEVFIDPFERIVIGLADTAEIAGDGFRPSQVNV